MRNYVGELAAISEDANKEIVLVSFGTGEQTLAAYPISPELNPIAPRQFCPRHAVFIPMQDDRFVGRPFHSCLLAWRMRAIPRFLAMGPPMTSITVENRARRNAQAGRFSQP